MKTEKTLVILKPDAINRSLVGEIISRFERKGLKMVGLKMIRLNEDVLGIHYSHLSERSFFNRLKNFMMRSPVIVVVLEGLDAIRVVRVLTGETHGAKANPGSIRGDYSMSNQCNVIHASEHEEAAKFEIERFFKTEELFDYDRIDVDMIYTNDERKG